MIDKNDEKFKPTQCVSDGWQPYTPNLNTFNRQGWICPKCGRAVSPDQSCCPWCDGVYQNNIVYCSSKSALQTTSELSQGVTENFSMGQQVLCAECKLSEEMKQKLLGESDSVFDAVYDYQKFIQECKKDCKVRNKNES